MATGSRPGRRDIHHVIIVGAGPAGCLLAGRLASPSVVDPRLRVRGVRNLRVIGASIMPNIVSGSTNAATMALASRGLELFRQEVAA
ncbi:GMC oxidoreductase [Sphingomonas desiccabilis]|uniref:Glucose-methanol-choline oxidoreductase C-terminal domain-containing protein n=1 Tax=Sphingomonas desiccabilis TaxID=429134 RepID=A0A4Q2INT1_9SPHN|nr:GMC oxidoreductase [Sphingomonas desiccabilis]RXZ29852.1 hypothetical protein EO081_15970 [Sphingomonas desiccabilis]